MNSIEKLSYFEGDTKFSLLEKTVNQVLLETVEKYPNKIAILEYPVERKITYKELYESICSFSVGLIDLGIGKGDRVSVWTSQSIETIIVYFALDMIGAVTVNLFPLNGIHQFSELIPLTRSKGLIISGEINDLDQSGKIDHCLEELKSMKPGYFHSDQYPDLKFLISFKENAVEGPITNFNSVLERGKKLIMDGFKLDKYVSQVSCHDPSQILLTSGTSGKPKVIVHSQFSLVNTGNFTSKRMNLNENDVYTNLDHIFHVSGKNSLSSCVFVGATIVIVPFKLNGRSTLVEAIQKFNITASHGNPVFYNQLIDEIQRLGVKITSLKKGKVTGFHCTQTLAEKIKSVLGMDHIINGYGLSESFLTFSTEYNSDFELFKNSIGKVYPHCSAKIINSNGNILPIGEIGQLVLKSYSNLLEYFGDKKKTDECLVDGWFYTGDEAKFDEDGNCTIIGRIVDTIKLLGNRIATKDIEDLIKTHPKIKDVQVFGIPNEKYGQSLVAWIILNDNEKENQNESYKEIKSFFDDKLSSINTTKRIEIVSKFPLSFGGKPSKKIMRELTLAIQERTG
eukprot:gene3151-3941_t